VSDSLFSPLMGTRVDGHLAPPLSISPPQ
jgi:hypothetical protein